MLRYTFTFLFIVSLCCGAGAAEMRSWTGSNGKIIEAELIEFDGETAKLKLKNGKEANVRLTHFSKEDQDFLKSGDKGKADDENPFAATETVKLPHEVLRIVIDVDDQGIGRLRLERSDTAVADEFGGKEENVTRNEKKVRLWRGQGGKQRIVFDYLDKNAIDWFGLPESGQRMLVLDTKGFEKPTDIILKTSGNYAAGMKLPIKITYDAVPMEEGECACLELVFDSSSENNDRCSVQFHVYCTSDLLDGKFRVLGQRSGPIGSPDRTTIDIFRANNIDANEAFESMFFIPAKKPQTMSGRFSIGRNLGAPDKTKIDKNACGVSYIELIGKLGL